MHHFIYRGQDLYCEDVRIEDIVREVGTPLYIYSHETLCRHFRAFDGAFSDMDHLTCFSVKSNSNIAILRLFANEGGGADIVSAGELFRCIKAGVPMERIVYSGVGKSRKDMEYAIGHGILMFNVESEQELFNLNMVAEGMGKKVMISLRVNPDIDPKTHPYISTGLRENKFGIPIADAPDLYMKAYDLNNLIPIGVSCHIGSQLTELTPFLEALERLLELIRYLKTRGLHIRYLDIGGGLGIRYQDEDPPHPKEYADAIKEKIERERLVLILEPGRVIVGNAGILLSKVLYRKRTPEGKNFIIVDAAMNDLIRPALYGSYHAIQPIKRRPQKRMIRADVVGPICESSDFLAKDREIEDIEVGQYLAIMSAGAYGFTMSSNYNSRCRIPEIMVKGNSFFVIRKRETFEDLIRGEEIPPYLLGE